ncbi:Fe-S cluster assembly protein SufB [Virgibacillus halodenitrificans]|jgi:Fe-S cluster assembly protein SufB|uniref:Fe-S cluster assembly protein SufB n=1 Tax=Virgibacillus halodenitrificans TaxID=1482 RepID=A0AAC9J1V6_VIRHA|nr:Fe-S cluster assembly protein SufB [Virgibacillus halodenitrificans]APC48993.1 Fe-S cluster assembly protein SufB [Virgibacillus halodenitrificans]MBD1223379.1 Fe-S cluster assembly protein SufB [Virgibacillus halodenitrificans]MCG1026957.1 Fe-S cluster assembly protein SufB [Virgibacillus halodenitrificans]MCJ0932707.1 Fe-S cluster assembly protein SufB [Virgibacillus halodenitrificans]MEC2159005.1 Fe-S cluster assembly protein SufB [Virgibacillus halodenitrificans]
MAKNMPEMEEYKYGFHDRDVSVFRSGKGLTREVVEEISRMKEEPQWMLDYRLKALEHFYERPMPQWGGDLSELNFDEIVYYVKPSEKQGRTWDEVPEEIKQTFDKLGIPEAEQKYLAGVSAQYESEVVYHSLKEDLEELGIVFKDTDTALKENEELFKEYFGKVIPATDNKFSALNSAVWSGGSFIYVPKGVQTSTPLQAYFRINSENMGQFERTLIIVDEGASVHYVEGCTAPVYTTNSLHSAVVEIFVKKDAYCRYTTIQNWANNVYNLVTKRATCDENATMEWIDGNIGSKLTMKYPAVLLKGEGARGMTLSIAIAGKGQLQDAGAKMHHLAPNTSSSIVSKSISKHGGKVSYRGIVHFGRKASGARSNIECDTLIMDNESTSDTIPYNEINNDNISLEHEAKVSKVSEEQLFYLMSRGLSEEEATEMIVMGFIEPFTKELPMEYAVEMNRLIKFEMEGSIG